MPDLDVESDVLVVGGGPAGSAAAGTLARLGRRVVVLEKARGTRYHVGESLVPWCWPTLRALGALEKVRAAGFQEKESVQFVAPDGRLQRPFYFREHLEPGPAVTWQVDRAAFDRLLLDHARDLGAEVREGVSANDLVVEGGRVAGVVATGEDGTRRRFRAPWTIDCSGRDGLAVRRLGWRVSERELDRVAVWTYWRGAVRDEGRDEGATTIARLPGDGWFWFLPLAGDLVSVGVIARAEELCRDERDLERIFDRARRSQPWIDRRLSSGAAAEPYRSTSDYSYRARHGAAAGLALAGDAFAFLDPVFSSGVYLALASGERAAAAVDRALSEGRTDAGALEGYCAWFTGHVEAMRRLVHAFYDPRVSFGRLVREHPDLRGHLTDGLVGRLDRDLAPLWAAFSEQAPLPPPLPLGGVFVGADP